MHRGLLSKAELYHLMPWSKTSVISHGLLNNVTNWIAVSQDPLSSVPAYLTEQTHAVELISVNFKAFDTQDKLDLFPNVLHNFHPSLLQAVSTA